MKYYLYNSTGSKIVITDIGLEIPSGENWELDANDIPRYFEDGGDYEALISSGGLLLTTDSDTPPSTYYSSAVALKILTLKTWAEEVVFIDNHSIGETDVQGAIDYILGSSVTTNLDDAYNNYGGTPSVPVLAQIIVDSGNVDWRLTPSASFNDAKFVVGDSTTKIIESDAQYDTQAYLSLKSAYYATSGTGTGLLINDKAWGAGGTGGGITLSTTADSGTPGTITVNSANATTDSILITTLGRITIETSNESFTSPIHIHSKGTDALHSQVFIESDGTRDDAIELDSAGGIGFRCGLGPFYVEAQGSITDAIYLWTSDTGVTSGIRLKADGSKDDAIKIETSGGFDFDTGAAKPFTLDSGSFSIDSTQSSNVSVTGADLTLSTITSGSMIQTSAGLMDVNAGANLDIDVTGSYDMLSTGAFSIDGTGASNVSATSGNLTVSTITSGNLLVTTAADLTFTIPTNLTWKNATTDWSPQQYGLRLKNYADADSLPTPPGSTSNLGAIAYTLEKDDPYIYTSRGWQKIQTGGPGDTPPGITYYYDETRMKWLSYDLMSAVYYHPSVRNLVNGYLEGILIPNDQNSGLAYAYDATITGISITDGSDDSTQAFYVYFRANGTQVGSTLSFSLTNGEYASGSLNIDFDANQRLMIQMEKNPSSGGLMKLLVKVYFKWRYTP